MNQDWVEWMERERERERGFYETKVTQLLWSLVCRKISTFSRHWPNMFKFYFIYFFQKYLPTWTKNTRVTISGPLCVSCRFKCVLLAIWILTLLFTSYSVVIYPCLINIIISPHMPEKSKIRHTKLTHLVKKEKIKWKQNFN